MKTKITKKSKKNDEKVSTKVKLALKNFFNNPVPLIIVLIALNFFLLLYISRYNDKNKIFVGLVDEEDVAVVNVHYFTNGDMNYFHASNAQYLDSDQNIYAYEIGYYVKNSNDEFVALAVRSGKLDAETSLVKIVSEMSGWSFAEPDQADRFFSDEVLNNLDKLYFRILASTEEGSTKSDVYVEHEVEVTKVTK